MRLPLGPIAVAALALMIVGPPAAAGEAAKAAAAAPAKAKTGAPAKFARAASDVRGKPKYPGPQGESWDSIKLLPDFGGVWSIALPGSKSKLGRPPPGPKPEYTPAAQAKLYAFNKSKVNGENSQTDHANCLPFAYPGSMGLYPIELLMTPGKVTVAIETDSQMQRIFTDGRPVPDDPDLTFQGTAVGHWEGDTLVSEVVGLEDAPKMEINPGVGHGPKLKIVQRAHLIQPDVLEIQWTYIDPDTLVKPWVTTRWYERHRDWDLQEYNCAQNNHDAADEKGRPSMKLN
ncbi:MAG: hypothetical protein ABIO39_09660 [Caulobacteraceae bacterium]